MTPPRDAAARARGSAGTAAERNDGVEDGGGEEKKDASLRAGVEDTAVDAEERGGEGEREGEEEKGKGEGTAGKGADRVAGVADA